MGIFGGRIFTYYRTRVRLRGELMGAIPLDPHVVQAWIRSKAGVEQQEELRQMMAKTLIELGYEVGPNQTFEEMVAASEGVAGTKNTCGFKRDDRGLYLEARYIKANLRETVNILYQYPKYKWGPTNKAPKAFFVERVFVLPDRLYLGRTEPDAIRPFVGHVSDRNGARATLTLHQAVDRPEFEFWLKVTRDAVEEIAWFEIWEQAEELGFGALRSQGFGKYDVLSWEKVAFDDVPFDIKTAIIPHEQDALIEEAERGLVAV